MNREASGYLHPAYAASFDDISTPRELAHCGGWILERRIPGSDLRDGMGCYPLFCCRDWTNVPRDLEALAGQLVSLTLVTDPFGGFNIEDLQRAFNVVRPYKRHYVTDLAHRTLSTRRHRRNTARATDAVTLARVNDPTILTGRWIELYGQLVARHGLRGLQAFSTRCLERQLAVPGLRMFSATADDQVVGLHLWYVQGKVAYGHLGATSQRGYQVMASYALYAFAIEQLQSEVRWLALGSVPGRADDDDGLARFKAGWATDTRQVYLCGKVLQPDAYNRLTGEGREVWDYFPAYRHGELAR